MVNCQNRKFCYQNFVLIGCYLLDELPVPPALVPPVELVPPAELGVPVALFIPLPAPIGLDALPDGIVDPPEVPLLTDALPEEAPVLEVELPVLEP